MSSRPEHLLLKALVGAACGWELAALGTGRVPTLSTLMWRVRHPRRALLWGVVVVALTDHFFWRRLL